MYIVKRNKHVTKAHDSASEDHANYVALADVTPWPVIK